MSGDEIIVSARRKGKWLFAEEVGRLSLMRGKINPGETPEQAAFRIAGQYLDTAAEGRVFVSPFAECPVLCHIDLLGDMPDGSLRSVGYSPDDDISTESVEHFNRVLKFIADITLFISDLDGTLIGPDAALTLKSVELLNRLIGRGVKFTAATARTGATAAKILSPLNLRLPVALMNGALIYDPVTAEYTHVERIPRKPLSEAFRAAKSLGVGGFLYTVGDDGQMHTYYECLNTPYMKEFCKERKEKYNKVFERIDSFESLLDSRAVYFSVRDAPDRLLPLYEILKNIGGIRVEFYRDVYDGSVFYLELCGPGASKNDAVARLKKITGARRLVCFGDNKNDLPMFAACDEAFAVANAIPEVIAAADGVVGRNDADGVAEYLAEEFETL